MKYKPEIFWNERVRIYGHTGWNDKLLYIYDQPLRLRAIEKVLTRAGITIDKHKKILDIGCGIGDLALEFAQKGADVTGVDISVEAIKEAKKRVKEIKDAYALNINFYATGVEDMKFHSNSFDLITSVTVLQHITEPQIFSAAITNMTRVLKRNGYILMLEFSPLLVQKIKQNSPYISVKTRQEWINIFKKNGCVLIDELYLPQIGIRTLRRYGYILALIPNEKVSCFIKKMLFIVLKPFDYYFIPIPKKFVDLRVLTFKNQE
ncbi:class I SAM-dependent methyltransferase [candidate division WOR-3 bacterium]|nr:class I SAM-dependent methyltransferase [candidate division WOR-3 bacterium]